MHYPARRNAKSSKPDESFMPRSLLLLATLLTLALLTGLAPSSQAGWFGGKYATVKAQNGLVSIPLSEVSDFKAHYYAFNTGKAEVKFFVLKSRDGVIRAAFDACDVCFPAKKGYTQDGDFMICNNCGQKFHSSKINVVTGGCNPSALNRVEQNGKLIIKAADIVGGEKYFL